MCVFVYVVNVLNNEKNIRKGREMDKKTKQSRLELHGLLNTLSTTDHIRNMELLIDQGKRSII